MQHMNDHDIAFARRRFGRGATPNRLAVAIMIDNLAEWTNMHSDGWAYWVKPRQAANRAMTEVNSTTNAANDEQERVDLTDAQMRAVVAPVRAFLTRHKVPAGQRERILRSIDAPTEV